MEFCFAFVLSVFIPFCSLLSGQTQQQSTRTMQFIITDTTTNQSQWISSEFPYSRPLCYSKCGLCETTIVMFRMHMLRRWSESSGYTGRSNPWMNKICGIHCKDSKDNLIHSMSEEAQFCVLYKQIFLTRSHHCINAWNGR